MSDESKLRVLPYGGQAVIEGVMLRSARALAVAVRRPDGRLTVRVGPWRSLAQRTWLLRRPFLRGALVLVESLLNGISALNFSASVALEEDGPKGSGKKSEASPVAAWFTVTLALALAVGLFVALPHLAVWLAGRLLGHELRVEQLSFHLLVGLVKLGVFIGYIGFLSLFPDVRRLFSYHGAEHQTIHALEAGEPLEKESVSRHPPEHPRCGTTFLIMVIAISILVFALVFPPLVWLFGSPTGVGWLDQVIYVLIKLPLLFPIAGLAYELQKFSAKHGHRRWARVLSWPGRLMQKLTTRKPDESQLEVALTSLFALLAAADQLDKDETKTLEETVLDFDDFNQARAAFSSVAGGDHA